MVLLYWQKSRCIDQWERLESSELDLHKNRQLIFDKGMEAI